MPDEAHSIDSCLLVVLYIVADYFYKFNDIMIVHGDKCGSLKWQMFIFNRQYPWTSKNLASAWPHWRKCFEPFCIASGLAAEAEEHQVNTLLYCLGNDAEDVLHSTNISEEDRKKYGEVLENFDQIFRVWKNVII